MTSPGQCTKVGWQLRFWNSTYACAPLVTAANWPVLLQCNVTVNGFHESRCQICKPDNLNFCLKVSNAWTCCIAVSLPNVLTPPCTYHMDACCWCSALITSIAEAARDTM